MTTKTITRSGLRASEFLGDSVPEQYREMVDDNVQSAESLVEAVWQEAERVKDDKNLTEKGRSARLAAFARQIDGKLEERVNTDTRKLDNTIEARKRLTQIDLPSVTELRGKEIRDAISAEAARRTSDEAELERRVRWRRTAAVPEDVNSPESVLLELAEAGDDEAFAAFLAGPLIFKRTIRDEVRKSAFRLLQRSAYPDVFDEIDALERVRTLLSDNLGATRQAIAKAAGLDPLALIREAQKRKAEK